MVGTKSERSDVKKEKGRRSSLERRKKKKNARRGEGGKNEEGKGGKHLFKKGRSNEDKIILYSVRYEWESRLYWIT